MNATTRAILIGAAVALLLGLVLVPLGMMAGCGMMGMGGMMGPGGMGGPADQPMPMMGGMGWLVLLFGLVVVVGVILLVLWAVRRPGERGPGPDEETPLAILQRRYARGEIGPEEYQRMRADLSQRGEGP